MANRKARFVHETATANKSHPSNNQNDEQPNSPYLRKLSSSSTHKQTMEMQGIGGGQDEEKQSKQGSVPKDANQSKETIRVYPGGGNLDAERKRPASLERWIQEDPQSGRNSQRDHYGPGSPGMRQFLSGWEEEWNAITKDEDKSN